MSEVAQNKEGFWKSRYSVITMCFFATFVCYIDRVNISVAIIPMAKDFGWDVETQGYILSSFYLGYLCMQIGGGRLADKFGGKLILGVGVLIWSLFTIITPWAALGGLFVLYLARIGMGLGEAVTFPSVYSLITRWFPNDEKAKAVALNASGIPLGTVFALIVTPIIVSTLSWQWAFYLFGLVGVIWFIAWQILVTNMPADHPHISKAELEYITANAPASGAVEDAPPLNISSKTKLCGPLLWRTFAIIGPCT